jgi:two-component system sensor histidine kinase/response regulator
MSRDEAATYSTDRETRQPSVLVVDDDPLIVALLTGLLTSKEYSVIKSYNGADALNVIKSRRVDLIICDVVMPSMNGYDFLEAVRKEVGSHIPVVFLSPSDGGEMLTTKLEKGVEHCIPKPIDPQALLAAVREAIGRQAVEEMITKRDFDAYRKRVVHTLSHEFRTPLSAINIGMELLLEHKETLDTDKATNLLEAVRRGGLRLERLVKDFLILQQMEAGITHEIFASHASVVTLSDMLQRYMSFKAYPYQSEGYEFRVNDRSEGSRVKVVEANILDCLDRIVSNAVKFSEKEKIVEIDVSIDRREARIAVKDRGCGIDGKQVEAAFDIFSQINRESKEQQGGGMGLPIARKYASAHKGRLEFKAREGGGSIVTLVLPLVDNLAKIDTDPLMREH